MGGGASARLPTAPGVWDRRRAVGAHTSTEPHFALERRYDLARREALARARPARQEEVAPTERQIEGPLLLMGEWRIVGARKRTVLRSVLLRLPTRRRVDSGGGATYWSLLRRDVVMGAVDVIGRRLCTSSSAPREPPCSRRCTASLMHGVDVVLLRVAHRGRQHAVRRVRARGASATRAEWAG